MPTYVGEDYIPSDRSGKNGYLAEKYNFRLRSNGRYYGYLRPSSGGKVDISNFDSSEAGVAKGVTVVFVAPKPGIKKQSLRVVGFYKRANLHAEPVQAPDKLVKKAPLRIVSDNATIIPEDLRDFELTLPKVWGSGSYRFPDEKLAVQIQAYVDSFEEGEFSEAQRRLIEADPEVIKEWITVSMSERKERRSSENLRSAKLKHTDDYQCACCDLKLQSSDHISMQRMFEVHHTNPVALLALGDIRDVDLADLAVVCANCHRAIHAPGEVRYVSNLAAFRVDVLGLI